MTIGMLWWDDSDKPLSEKVRRAMQYYEKKYGRVPDLCLVNPRNMEPVDMSGITVRPYRPVLIHHLWIGNEDTPRSRA